MTLERLWPLAFTCFVGGAFLYLMMISPPAPVYEYHDVNVWSQPKGSTNQWWISGLNMPMQLWNCCPDFPCGRVIWPGYVMKSFRYQDFGSCKSIRRQDLGVVWQRDSDGNVKEIGQ